MLGRVYYILGDFQEAKKYFEAVLKERPTDIFSMSKLSSIAFKTGEEGKALSFLDEIQRNKKSFDFGYTNYFVAQAMAQGQRFDEAFRFLKEAVKEGDLLSVIDYENDPLLEQMHAMPEWQDIMNYWTEKN